MNELEEIHAMYDMTVAQFSGASDVKLWALCGEESELLYSRNLSSLLALPF